ncbi:hypothetical protein J6590_031571 [Homalodisca vitripennis]|nr:hypothetical protein J6590_031571 [Homalodisca vitripennis]
MVCNHAEQISVIGTFVSGAALRGTTPSSKMELIETHGFVSQQHQVITEDGYVLTLHRIMRQSGPRRPPVLLQHGILCSSACWVLRGTQKELAIMLVEAGYDVWLGNVRGNTYCKSHLRLDNTMEKFWNYSTVHNDGVRILLASFTLTRSISITQRLSYNLQILSVEVQGRTVLKFVTKMGLDPKLCVRVGYNGCSVDVSNTKEAVSVSQKKVFVERFVSELTPPSQRAGASRDLGFDFCKLELIFFLKEQAVRSTAQRAGIVDRINVLVSIISARVSAMYPEKQSLISLEVRRKLLLGEASGPPYCWGIFQTIHPPPSSKQSWIRH